MEQFTKPSITRIARKAGIKNLSDESYNMVRNLISMKVEELIEKSLIVNDERGTKTIMCEDVVDALRLSGVYLSKSNDLSNETCLKT